MRNKGADMQATVAEQALKAMTLIGQDNSVMKGLLSSSARNRRNSEPAASNSEIKLAASSTDINIHDPGSRSTKAVEYIGYYFMAPDIRHEQDSNLESYGLQTSAATYTQRKSSAIYYPIHQCHKSEQDISFDDDLAPPRSESILRDSQATQASRKVRKIRGRSLNQPRRYVRGMYDGEE